MSFEIPESIKVYSQFLHPILMWLLFGITLYSMYLGFKIRKTRSAEGEEKKQLIQGRFNIRHHQLSALLLAFMVTGSIGGMAVTYWNSGKLFVTPHLVVGLVMTAMIATSASLTPFMQKGNNIARYTHIVLNMGLVILFGWQAVSGMDIVQRIVARMAGAA